MITIFAALRIITVLTGNWLSKYGDPATTDTNRKKNNHGDSCSELTRASYLHTIRGKWPKPPSAEAAAWAQCAS